MPKYTCSALLGLIIAVCLVSQSVAQLNGRDDRYPDDYTCQYCINVDSNSSMRVSDKTKELCSVWLAGYYKDIQNICRPSIAIQTNGLSYFGNPARSGTYLPSPTGPGTTVFEPSDYYQTVRLFSNTLGQTDTLVISTENLNFKDPTSFPLQDHMSVISNIDLETLNRLQSDHPDIFTQPNSYSEDMTYILSKSEVSQAMIGNIEGMKTARAIVAKPDIDLRDIQADALLRSGAKIIPHSFEADANFEISPVQD